MVVLSNAKLNIGLHITGRRPDGYHLIESVFLPIPLYDVIELTEYRHGAGDMLRVLGDIDSGALEDNLVLRAIRALRLKVQFPWVEVTLKKQIPSGAGMGGGSSNASHTLKALRDLFGLDINTEQLEEIALSLGADCPFFIHNSTSLVKGIGEDITPNIHLDLSAYNIVVVKPPLHISTAEAFGGLRKIGGHLHTLEELIQNPIQQWRESICNDFEESLFPNYPILMNLKYRLYDVGAVYASLTGSGAALYALFERRLTKTEMMLFSDVFFWQSMC